MTQFEELRDTLGKRVREVWIAWAKEQPNPKKSWLTPWEDLTESEKEVDRRIGSVIWNDCISVHAEAIAENIIKKFKQKQQEAACEREKESSNKI